MAFDANREMKIEASESSPGLYQLRTRGLADKRRPELEILGVPEAGLNAAGGVINLIAAYTIDKAEVVAGQSVGNVLAVGDEGRRLLLVVRAVAAEKPKSGLWSKIAGSGKGVLRLVDATGGDTDPPVTALATMLVHRAAVRLAKGDGDGAREELEAAIATFPGEPGAGAPPTIDGAEGVLDWQNHLAYLELASLTEDVEAAAAHFGAALARSDELARRELGATVAELSALDDGAVAQAVTRALERELAGNADGAARVTRDGATLVTTILARDREVPWRPAWIARAARGGSLAPREGRAPEERAADGLASIVLADVARCLRAEMANEEILALYHREPPAAEIVAE